MSISLKRLLLMAALLFWVTGCENGSEDFVAVGGQPQPSSTSPFSSGQITGTFRPGTGIQGADVSAVDAGGRTLAQAKTDGSGNFDFPDFRGPADFRVVARIGSGLEFSTAVTGYSGGGRYVVINVPTSLVSQCMLGGMSQEQASAAVKRYLSIPDDRSLEFGIEESPRAPFSHIAFLQQAGASGGWPSFRDAVANEIVSSQEVQPREDGPFLLNVATAAVPITGLDPSLSTPLEQLRQSERLQESVRSASFDRALDFANLTAGSLSPSTASALLSKQNVIRASLVSSILETVADGAKSQIIDVGWTHIADACHWNYGTTTMLGYIEQTVDEISTAVSDIQATIDAYQLQLSSDAAQSYAVAFQTTSKTLKTLSFYNSSNVGLPSPPNSTADSFITQNLSDLNAAQTNIAEVQSLCQGGGGGSNIVTQNRDNVYQDQLGAQGDQSVNFSPVRSNGGIQPRILSTYQYYANSQVLGMNLLAETAHVAVTNPAVNIMTALNFLAGVDPTGGSDSSPLTGDVNLLKQQRNQLPQYLMSDKLVVDLQGGVMYYTDLQAATTYNLAAQRAGNFTLDVGSGVTLGDWRLPTDQELYLLQDRGRLVATGERDSSVDNDGSNDGYGNYGYSAAGLTALGFNNVALLNDPSGSNGYCTTFATDYTWDTHGTNHWTYQPLNFSLNRESNTTSNNDGTGNYAYFLVRNIGEPVLSDDRNAPDGNYAYPYESINAAEFTTLGYMTALTETFGVNSSQAGVTATFTVNTGGSFTMGNSDASDSRDLVSRIYTQSVSSNSADAGPVDLMEMVWFNSADSTKLTLNPLGQFVWHTDSSGSNYKVNFTSNSTMADGTRLANTGYHSDSPGPRTVKVIQIYPRNKQYDLSGNSTATSDNYYCVAYLSDDTVLDVTNQVVFSSVDNATGAPTTGNTGFSPSANAFGLFSIDRTAPPLVKIQAQYTRNGKVYTDSTLCEPLLP